MPATGLCVTGKLTYENRELAENALASAMIAQSIRRREKRVYECARCGRWHLTSQELPR